MIEDEQMPKYKILTVAPFFPPNSGGLANHVLNLGQSLARLGNHITIVTSQLRGQEKQYSNQIFDDIIRIKSVYLPGWPYASLRNFSIPSDLGAKIKSIIRDGKFDLVHVHGHHFPISWMAINAAQKFGVPSVLTLHGVYALNPNVLGGRSWIEEYFNRIIFSKVLVKNKAAIGLTPIITNYAKKWGNDSMKYFTIPNGVNTLTYKENLSKKDKFREKFHLEKNSKVILFCGRFEFVKGIDEFVIAAKKIAKKESVEVLVVGRGSLEYLVKSTLSGEKNIHIYDWLPTETVHEAYIASDIFVLPSKFEALPITLLEAMNAGLYIIHTTVGGISDILKGYGPKSALEKGTGQEIFEVLEKTLDNFSFEGREDALSYARQFDWDKIATDTLKVYDLSVNL